MPMVNVYLLGAYFCSIAAVTKIGLNVRVNVLLCAVIFG